ncbi:adenosylcobinamide amidohydrolase [Pseudodonghicola flavimaris]|uniref:Adenosylcobinamide amidohydrolase n=1 Tax=Pseudodonghicola flavimaris TaxID=3050036 RepID=A0ABT7EZ22_9RHOB|nr:adenosylcobinamide amidohydrolase [Pseudodonghicola flavimaris]MDK3017583.1 adenosylcobinamide amidohydrolase [Pseudodonghicola flavimaris]
MKLTLERPWLELDLGAPHRVLSWSLTRPGFVTADRILWREVRNADLPEGLDVLAWYRAELAARGAADAVAMLTSRTLSAYEVAEAEVDGIRAFCVATVGLSNAERIGTRLDRSGNDWGTINVALHLELPLTEAALLETLSIVTQARTAAVMEAGLDLPDGRATGTGTDCIAVAAPAGDTPYAGLHTPQAEAVGRATYAAVRRGADIWMRHVRRPGVI